MKIKFYGTAAAEGIPALFCDCYICRYAREHRGKDVKTRSQALVDGKILIDFPADTYMHMLYGGLDLKSIRTLIITHGHADHLYERDFWCRSRGIANDIPENEPLNVYVAESGYEHSKLFIDEKMKDTNRVVLHKIEPFVAFDAEGYTITPLAADHDQKSSPVIYIIEKDGKRLLYAHDTGIFPEKSWQYLSEYKKSFDFVSIDCTSMLLKGYNRHHLGLDGDVMVIDRLRNLGLIDSNTKIYANHFSHNGRATHDELVTAASEYGFGVTYDGLEVEF